jgi:hypothetical protein
MGIYIKVRSSNDAGSCSTCHDHTSPDGWGSSEHTVCEVFLEPTDGMSQSFRLCSKCRLELIKKLKDTSMSRGYPIKKA